MLGGDNDDVTMYWGKVIYTGDTTLLSLTVKWFIPRRLTGDFPAGWKFRPALFMPQVKLTKR